MSRHFGGVNATTQSEKTRVIVLLSLFCIVVFSIVAFFFLSSSSSSSVTAAVVDEDVEIKMAPVLVPTRKIEAGEALDPSMFRAESRPAVSVSGSVIGNYDQIHGFFAKKELLKGELLFRENIADIRPTNVLAANIPEGFRAVTIKVDKRSSVEGWARPGSKVDVVWASKIRGRPGVTIIVQNAKVLSAERQTTVDEKTGIPVPDTVTLLVNAEDAAKIQLASTTGTLSLSLRGDADKGKSGQTSSITIDDLLGNTTNNDEIEDEYDSVMINGEKWYLRKGKLTPAKELRKKQEKSSQEESESQNGSQKVSQ